MSDEPVLFGRSGPVARITLNRPAQGNAINLMLAQAATAVVATYTQDNLVRGFGDAKDHTGDYQRIM